MLQRVFCQSISHEIDAEANFEQVHSARHPALSPFPHLSAQIVVQGFPYVGRAGSQPAELREVAVATRVDVTGSELTTLK